MNTKEHKQYLNEFKAYSKEIEMIRRGISESEKSQGDWLNNKKKFSQKLFFKHPWLSLFVGEYFRETGCDGPVLGYDAGSNKYIKYNTKLYM